MGIDAIIAATRGEYAGSGSVQADKKGQKGADWLGILAVVFLLFVIVRAAHSKSAVYHGRRRLVHGGSPPIFWGAGWRGGGGSGWGGGAGGGFSGGGGSFGGGGASGDW